MISLHKVTTHVKTYFNLASLCILLCLPIVSYTNVLFTFQLSYLCYNSISFGSGCNYMERTMKLFVWVYRDCIFTKTVDLSASWMRTVFHPGDVFANPNALCARNGKSRPEIPLLFKERYAPESGFSVL